MKDGSTTAAIVVVSKSSSSSGDFCSEYNFSIPSPPQSLSSTVSTVSLLLLVSVFVIVSGNGCGGGISSIPVSSSLFAEAAGYQSSTIVAKTAVETTISTFLKIADGDEEEDDSEARGKSSPVFDCSSLGVFGVPSVRSSRHQSCARVASVIHGARNDVGGNVRGGRRSSRRNKSTFPSDVMTATMSRRGGGGDVTATGETMSTTGTSVRSNESVVDGSDGASPLTAPLSMSSLVAGGVTKPSSGKKNLLTTIRNVAFPIHGREEVTKFLLIGSIKFFVILALTLTRDAKDVMIVTECGAEAIAFLKIYGVLPAAALFIGLYSKMSAVFEKKALFYATCVPFFVFFAVFDACIYPNRERLQPTLETVRSLMGVAMADGASVVAVSGGGGGRIILSKLLANWTSALFYVVAEVYSSASVGILFWQFANDVVPVSQARRFYPLFAQMSGFAPVLAGQYVVRYASRAEDFAGSLHRSTALVTFAGVMICMFYHLSNSFIEGTEDWRRRIADAESTAATTTKKKKPKMSMAESAKFLASSEYLRLIATLVVGYGLSINFTEIMWKSIVKRQYPNPLDYQRFMGNFSSVVGLSTCLVIFVGVHAIRVLGWSIGALATPTVMAVLAIPYFFSILAGGLESPSGLRVAVIFGTIQTLLSKTFKYALFDPTTQMTYIPLDEESKVKGKAAIEVLGSRIGKSGGSLIQQGLILAFGNIIDAAPILMVLLYSVLLWWAYSANRLGTLFLAKTAMQEEGKKQT